MLGAAAKFAMGRPALAAGIGLTALAGGAAGVSAYRNPDNKAMSMEDHVGISAASAERAAIVSAGGLMAAAAVAKIGTTKAGMSMGASAFSSGMSSTMRALSRPSAYVPLGGGLIGAALGAHFSDDPGKGAALGAGIGIAAGVAARGAVRAGKAWNAIGKPGQIAALVLGTAGIVGGAKAIMGNRPAETADPVSDEDGSGGYTVPNSGLRQRLATLNATGDLVFGMHRGRHA